MITRGDWLELCAQIDEIAKERKQDALRNEAEQLLFMAFRAWESARDDEEIIDRLFSALNHAEIRVPPLLPVLQWETPTSISVTKGAIPGCFTERTWPIHLDIRVHGAYGLDIGFPESFTHLNIYIIWNDKQIACIASKSSRKPKLPENFTHYCWIDNVFVGDEGHMLKFSRKGWEE